VRVGDLFRLLHHRGVDFVEEVLVVLIGVLLAEGLLGVVFRREHEGGLAAVDAVGLLVVSLSKELVQILVAHFEG